MEKALKYHENNNAFLNYYCVEGDQILGENCVLLGFKNCLPVLRSNRISDKTCVSPEIQLNVSDKSARSSDSSCSSAEKNISLKKIRSTGSKNKKMLVLHLDPATGEKYINLHGKKLKMVESPLALPVNVRKSGKINEEISDKKIEQEATKLHQIESEKPSTDKKIVIIKKVPAILSKNRTPVDLIGKKAVSGKRNSEFFPDLSNLNTDLDSDSQVNLQSMKSFRSKRKNSTSVAVCTTEVPIKIDKAMQTDKDLKTFVDNFCQTDKTAPPNQDSNLMLWDSPFASPFPDLLQYFMNDDDFATTNPAPIIPVMNGLGLYSQNTGLGSNVGSGNVMANTGRNLNNLKKEDDRRLKFFIDLRGALQPDHNGNLPIHDSVLKNDVKLVKRHCVILKARKESVNLANQSKHTPLQIAVIHDSQTEIVKILLESGANLSDIDDNGHNILHLAIEHKRKDLLEILLKHAMLRSFNLDNFNYEGQTPLMMCCNNNLFNCAKLLLENGSKPNIRDQKSGRTALFHAAENHDLEMVRLLMYYKADTKIRNFFGTSPHDAMYEVEEIPQDIKSLILAKNSCNKRKIAEEPEKRSPSKKTLQVTSKYQKVTLKVTSISKPAATKVKAKVSEKVEIKEEPF